MIPIKQGDKIAVTGKFPPYEPGDSFVVEATHKLPNLIAAFNQGIIHVVSSTDFPAGNLPDTEGEVMYFPLHKGRGQYDVIRGVKVNDAPLTKEEAYNYEV